MAFCDQMPHKFLSSFAGCGDCGGKEEGGHEGAAEPKYAGQDMDQTEHDHQNIHRGLLFIFCMQQCEAQPHEPNWVDEESFQQSSHAESQEAAAFRILTQNPVPLQ